MDNQTIKKDYYTLVKDFKNDLLACYELEELMEYFDNGDFVEIVDSFIPVYYSQLIDECYNLTGDIWSRIWLDVDDLANNYETQSPYDVLKGNLFGLYYDCIYKALEEITKENKKEEE